MFYRKEGSIGVFPFVISFRPGWDWGLGGWDWRFFGK